MFHSGSQEKGEDGKIGREELTDDVQSVDLGDFRLSAHLTFVKAGVSGLCRANPLQYNNNNNKEMMNARDHSITSHYHD